MMLQEENEDSAADRVLIDITAKGKPGLLRRYRHENRPDFEELLNKRVVSRHSRGLCSRSERDVAMYATTVGLDPCHHGGLLSLPAVSRVYC